MVFMFRIAQTLHKIRLGFLSSVIMKLVYHFYSCDIRYTAKIGPGFKILHPIGIVICGKVKIGRDLSIRQNTIIGGNSGKVRRCYGSEISQPMIKDNVVIGCN